MDFSVFNKIQPFNNTYSQPRRFTQSFSAYPAKDYVNPGVVGSVQLYSNLVPIYGHAYTNIEKKIPEVHSLQKDLEGEGFVDKDVSETTSQSGSLSESERQSILDDLNKTVKEKLPASAYQNILHPGGIRTGKLLVNEKNEPAKESLKRKNEVVPSQIESNKKVKPNLFQHKFQFV
jgi:hypothetical protein